jgi:DNA-directed RNA polymerase sigma subunit (sigma70/sigma32)
MEYGKMIRTPIHITERINQLRILEEKMTNEFGRKPSIEELSLAAGYKPSEVIQYKTITTAPISLDGSLRTDEESSVIDFVKEEGNSSEDFFIADKKKRRIIEIFETIITDSWE